jgi:phytoene dehydrogenase-like protein
MRKTVSIIGAGIAGLSAGCYLQMNGYETEIFELHNLPGGLCTSWKRKDFTIDGCIHWLVGSSPANEFYRFWNELIEMNAIEFVDYEEYTRVEDKTGQCIRVFTDVNKLQQELFEKAPEDRELIIEFTNAIKTFSNFNPPMEKAIETYTLVDWAKMGVKLIPYWGALRKWSKMSVREYAERCHNPLLKKTLYFIFGPDIALLFILMTLVWMHQKSAGYPVGGSLNFAKLIEQKYKELGGKIHYKSKVTKILTEHDSATGILLENGETHRSDIVLSAADGRSTIFDMLAGKYLSEEIKGYYDHYELFPSYLQVSLGVARIFENEPHAVVFPLEHPLIIDDRKTYEDIMITIYNFDPTLAPEGKTVIIALLSTPNYTYWENLRQSNREKYQAEKERIANVVIDALESKFGNIRSNIEVTDVSTPATVIRYTNNWKGSLQGWFLSPKMGFKTMKKVLPGLKNFYMAGQWVQPGGGLPGGIMSGRQVTQIICKEDKKTFVTTC